MMKNVIGSVVLSLVAVLSLNPSASASAQPSAEYYQGRYHTNNIYDKIVDNQGNGFEPLYGLRNMRVVLNGVVYRGGANNAYNKHGKRNNSNPLPTEGLQHLCQEGFSTAVYLYDTRYSSAPHQVSCQTVFGDRNTVDYEQESVLSSDSAARAVLKLVHSRLASSSNEPIYLHCWNGWHASGFISSLILRQFCGFSGDQAVAYWNKNTDGNNGSSYEGIRRKIRAFVPYSDLSVHESVLNKVCPNR